MLNRERKSLNLGINNKVGDVKHFQYQTFGSLLFSTIYGKAGNSKLLNFDSQVYKFLGHIEALTFNIGR